MTAEPVIEVQKLWTRRGRQVIHRDLDLRVEAGEIIGLVGGSGSGKTTLLRVVIGLDAPMRGTARLFGVDPLNAPRRQRLAVQQRFGTLFQAGALFSALTVFDNVALPLRELRSLDQRLIRDLVMLKLHLVEIEPIHAGKMPAELSGGMIKRVALARALALDPELLVLDEPTAGLDPDRSRSFVKLIQSLSKEHGLTVFMVTHDVDTLSTLATRVAVLAEGRIVADGPLDQIRQNDHPFIASFFGTAGSGAPRVEPAPA
ncbi:MAG TPA: ATP-binding cassette domain-containing protein [Burkholderiales bacterium]|nr:ATP-binding cassette domain-containing protein [Burkholderiales bacterium]